MVAGDIAEFALKAAARADYAEARFESASSNEFVLKNGVLEASETSETQGLCVRVLVRGAQGSAFTNRLDKPSVKAAVNRAVRMAGQCAKIVKEPVKLSDEQACKANYSVAQRIPLADVSSDVKIRELISIDKAMLATGVNLPARFLTLHDETREKYYVNSNGSSVHAKIPRVLFDYMLTASAEGRSVQRMFSFGASSGWEAFKKWDVAGKLAEEAVMLKKILSTAQPMPHGELDVVLSPELVGIASHESVGHPYEADRILGREAAQAGESFVVREMLGTKIGSDVVNVVDDPRLPGSYGYYLYDDEGVKANRRFLIKNGIITSFLQNRWSASHFGISSNGSARANNWDAEPIVRMANTYTMAGDYATEELFRDIKKGVYIKSYMEWNIDDKRFNQRYTGLEAYLIENGEVKHLVRNPVLEITTPVFWSSVDAVGKNVEYVAGNCGKGEPMQGIPVWFGGPHIRMRKIKFGEHV